MKRITCFAFAAMSGLAIAAPALAQDSEFIGVPMFGEHVPERGGQEDATGDFDSEFDAGGGRICYYLELMDVRDPIGLAIHRGEEGENGPLVASLQLPTSPDDETCVTVAGALIREMIASPGEFYIIVTSPGNPDGALRGQLDD